MSIKKTDEIVIKQPEIIDLKALSAERKKIKDEKTKAEMELKKSSLFGNFQKFKSIYNYMMGDNSNNMGINQKDNLRDYALSKAGLSYKQSVFFAIGEVTIPWAEYLLD